MAKNLKLSNKKQKWVKQFNPNVIVGEPLRPNHDIEKKTVRKVERLTNKMIKEFESEVIKLFKKESPAYFAQDASISSQVRILLNKLEDKFYSMFNLEGNSIANYMVNAVNNHSKAQIKNSLKKLSGGLSINVKDLSSETKEILKSSASQSSSYIRSIQSKYLDEVAGYTYRSITQGEGLKDLIPQLQALSGKTRRNARLLALDQTRKTNSTLDEARMRQNGITKFRWNHSSAGKTQRQTHIEFDGQIYDLNDPPYDRDAKQKVMPAELPHCRCFKTPVIEFS
jgi:SPP1 gp7 family putative phage head morphogenesis protein